MLIGLNLAGAVFFAVVLVYVFSRGGQKSKINPESQPTPSDHRNAGAVFTDPNATVFQPQPSHNLLDEIDTSILSNKEPGRSNSSFSDRNFSNFSKNQVKAEDGNMNTPDPNTERIDLAARLEGSSPSTPSVPAQSSEFVELLRLLRDPHSGQLIVEIAGRRYAKLADITDKRIGQYVLKLAAHLLAFTNGMIATEAGVKSVHYPKVGETPTPIVAPASVSPTPPPAAVASHVQPIQQDEPQLPVATRPAIDPESILLDALRTTPTAPAEKPQRKGILGLSGKPATSEPRLPKLNLAGQINDIVQTRLASSPLAGNTRIEIVDDPGGGIRINVNEKHYSGPDDIPDAQVRDLIKAAIKEWERS
jgi:hypothetical protein